MKNKDSKIIVRESDGTERVVECAVLFGKEGDCLTTLIRNVNPMDLMVFAIRMLEELHKHSLLALFIYGMGDCEIKRIIRKALEE